MRGPRSLGDGGGGPDAATGCDGEQGFTLVETLVAFVVLALGVTVALEGVGLVSARMARVDAAERASDALVLGMIDAPVPDGPWSDGTMRADRSVSSRFGDDRDGARTVARVPLTQALTAMRVSIPSGTRPVTIDTIVAAEPD